MSATFWLKGASTAIVIVFGASMFVAWRGVRHEQAQLQEKLRSAEQALRDADAREDARKTELDQQLSKLQKTRAAVQTPEQVVKALPAVLALPKPLSIEDGPEVPPTRRATGAGKAEAPSPKVLLPTEDLKPLYDAAVECKACQAELAAAHGNLADEKTKTQALSRERDDALQAARGGSVLRRVARAAKWFAIGAAAGAVAAKIAH